MQEHHLLHHSIYMHKGMPIGATAHQAGTVRFGTDPASSALDVNCRAHEVDNLYVVDTSFFPSIGAVNPSLTAIANALRVGDHLDRTARLTTRTDGQERRAWTTDRVDALVIFGATGDLAKLETFPALVGLVDRGVLDVPVVGVAKSGWGLEQFREYAAASLRNNGMDPDAPAGARRCSACCATSTATWTTTPPTPRCREEMGDGKRALFYLEVPPFLFGRIAQGISAAGRADGARVMVEKPFGTDLASARALNETMHAVLPRGRHLPGRPLAGPGPAGERAGRPVRQLDARAAAQPRPRGEHPDHHGRGVRRRRPRPVLRPDRRHPRRRAEPHAAGAGQRARRSAGRPGLEDSWLDAKARVVAALRPLTPADAVRGQYEGYRDVEGVDPASTMETYVAVRLALDSWRWAGVPILIRAGKTMPVTATEVTIRFRPAAVRRVRRRRRARSTTSCASGSGPKTEIGLTLAGKKPGAGCEAAAAGADVRPAARADMRPYDRLIGAALDGKRVLFARQDTVEAAWRVVDPSSATPSRCTPTRAAAGGPRRPTRCCPTATPGTTRPGISRCRPGSDKVPHDQPR